MPSLYRNRPINDFSSVCHRFGGLGLRIQAALDRKFLFIIPGIFPLVFQLFGAHFSVNLALAPLTI
jgi:hypothetical protein